MTKKTTMGARAKAKIRRNELLLHIARKPMTSQEASDWMGVSVSTSHKDMRALHDERLIHIVGYEGIDDIRSTPVYALGDGKDVEMPEKKRLMLEKRAESISEGYRERPVIVAFRHWLDVALFGEYRRVA